MLNTFTCTFFGHRDFSEHHKCGEILEQYIRNCLSRNEFTEFLVGKNGEFDQFVTSVLKRVKNDYDESGNSLILVLPYATSEYEKNKLSFEKYYDEIEISARASSLHFKAAIQERNKEMIDRADAIVCFVERNEGGAYKSIEYAIKKGKNIVNLAAAIKNL